MLVSSKSAVYSGGAISPIEFHHAWMNVLVINPIPG